ncbi:hypothetical protein TEA_015561 [Camellia sinensis var. sinensis]|uniref:F-box domain-containing protein n=1 Tax=Camellia sinensis var. sinensis TaxID=542762 RepID=A0A4S4CXU0_CAMSN|nr:hypothetical protein TEA_015561 [Camellia sinensis var. sinensis]
MSALSPFSGNIFDPLPIVGKLGQTLEGRAKRRIFAIGNYMNQRLLKPFHDWLMTVLRQIPMDGTFNQTKPLDFLVGKMTTLSYDLKSATDRWPLLIMYEMDIIRRGLYLHSHTIYWCGGVLNHPGQLFKDYAILGDDVIIADEAVAHQYSSALSRLGVNLSIQKSLISKTGAGEFAKRFRVRGMSVDLSPVSIKALIPNLLERSGTIDSRPGRDQSTYGNQITGLKKRYRTVEILRMADEQVVGSKQKEILGHKVSMMTSTSSDHLVHDKIKHGERGSSNWSDLPPELLSMILSNLFLGDSSNFSATCRSWQSITTPFPPPTNSALSKLPYLMILNGGDDGCKFFQQLRNETYHDKLSNIIISNDQLKDAKIRVSTYGWLLMSGELCIIKRGDDRWTFHEFQNNRRFVLYDASPPVLYNGKLYCLGNGGDVGVLDLSSSLSWSIICCCKPILAWPRFKYQCQKSFMVNCDGGMLVVFVTHEERRVRLIKLIVPDMEWQDVQSLGNKMLFLSHGASLLVEAVKEGMANKIYFPNFHGENGVFYSLNTGKYHSIVGCSCGFKNYHLLERYLVSCDLFRYIKWYQCKESPGSMAHDSVDHANPTGGDRGVEALWVTYEKQQE